MVYDPCNPPRVIHHQAIGRFKHRGRIGHHHAHHHAHHTVAGCPKVSVLDVKRFGALPTLITSALKAIGPVVVVVSGLAGGAAIGGSYWGGYWGGYGSGSGSHFVCTKESRDKRCQHVVQVPEPNTLVLLAPLAILLVLCSKRRPVN